jgi:hypothetical protein
MECSILSEEFVCSLDEQKYVDFCQTLNQKTEETEETEDLTIFNNKRTYEAITQISGYIFKDEIKRLSTFMNDPYIGISALDVPETNNFDKKLNSVYGIAVAMGIFGNIGNPSIDFINKMPFEIFSASHENLKLLESKELIQYPPGVKLGFHNDGMFSDNEINIPLHIMVYNMYINYRRPGNFKWVPIASWGEADKFINLLKEKLAKIRITPNFYFDDEGKIKSTLVDMIEVPICQVNDGGERLFFLNGSVLQADNGMEIVDLVNAMRDSISNNHMKILINQKERRAIYLKNDFGFHARDIFEDPIEDADLTRVFIRAVDLNVKKYSSY